MRALILLVSTLFSANALAVVVDFESDVTVVEYDVPNAWPLPQEKLPVRIDSKGFSFGYQGDEASWGGETLLRNPSQGLPAGRFDGLFNSADNGNGLVYRIWREDGQRFNLNSMDLYMGFNLSEIPPDFICCTYGSLTILGYKGPGVNAAGRNITAPIDNSLVHFTADITWTDLEYIEVQTQFEYPVFGFSTQYSPGLDNFNASVIPVPAAIWLFLSGLSVLGFARRLR